MKLLLSSHFTARAKQKSIVEGGNRIAVLNGDQSVMTEFDHPDQHTEVLLSRQIDRRILYLINAVHNATYERRR